MKCPLCDIEAQITSSKLVMIGDKLYRRQIFKCRNKNCHNYNEEVGRIDNPLEYIVEEGEKDESSSR